MRFSSFGKAFALELLFFSWVSIVDNLVLAKQLKFSFKNSAMSGIELIKYPLFFACLNISVNTLFCPFQFIITPFLLINSFVSMVESTGSVNVGLSTGIV